VRQFFCVLLLFTVSCSQTKLGEGGSVISGSGGSAGAKGATAELPRCEAPIATIALVEDPGGYAYMSRFSLPSPTPLLRLLMQQSNCFRVVDRSAGLAASEREQELAARGVLRNGQTVRKQQVVEAQYSLLSSVVFSEQNAGDSFGGLVSQIPVLGRFAGALGNVNFKEAQTVLFLTDNETAEQVASATGAARATDIGGGGLLIGGLSGIAGGWSTSNEGKVIAAALLDSYAKLVPQARVLAQKQLPAKVPTR
jgi:curli biogenesis system outer membrane secretion channel CsgG